MSRAAMSPNHFDESITEDFFAGRTLRGRISHPRRAAALIPATRSPASSDELAAEDQLVAAFMDASGSLWIKHRRFGTHTHWLTAHCLWLLIGAGRYLRGPRNGKPR
jgi:hypothetical protein